MRKYAAGLMLGAVVLAAVPAWKIGECELANAELRDDMQDMASQIGTRVGLSSSKDDDDLRKSVVRAADRYGIGLTPEQVHVHRESSIDAETLYLQADYTVDVKLSGVGIKLHFTPSSGRQTITFNSLH